MLHLEQKPTSQELCAVFTSYGNWLEHKLFLIFRQPGADYVLAKSHCRSDLHQKVFLQRGGGYPFYPLCVLSPSCPLLPFPRLLLFYMDESRGGSEVDHSKALWTYTKTPRYSAEPLVAEESRS